MNPKAPLNNIVVSVVFDITDLVQEARKRGDLADPEGFFVSTTDSIETALNCVPEITEFDVEVGYVEWTTHSHPTEEAIVQKFQEVAQAIRTLKPVEDYDE